MSAHALRGYIKTLRTKRGVTQAEIAEQISMPLPTYKDWERGITKDIKTPYLVRAVQYLHGSFEQIASLSDTATIEDGEALARELAMETLVTLPVETPQEESRMDRLLRLLADGLSPQEAARRTLHQP